MVSWYSHDAASRDGASAPFAAAAHEVELSKLRVALEAAIDDSRRKGTVEAWEQKQRALQWGWRRVRKAKKKRKIG